MLEYINLSQKNTYCHSRIEIFIMSNMFALFMWFIDLFKLLRPLSKKEKEKIEELEEFLYANEAKKLKRLVKLKKAAFSSLTLGVSDSILKRRHFTILQDSQDEFIKEINEKIVSQIKKKAFKEFSENAPDVMIELIAPNIVGLHRIKEAVSLQLFADERVHILLLGDPATGKTDIVRAAAELSPAASFGLGSGISGAGLGLMFKGDELIMGLLPKSNGGICCIDELNLIRKDDLGYLYNAMEKGFISYDKAGKSIQLNADVKVLATANPLKDRFTSTDIELLRKQIPLDAALLTRFHIVFIIRKPSLRRFIDIAKKMVKQKTKELSSSDISFIKEYISYCKKIDVEFPMELQKKIVEFAGDMKERERSFVMDVSPRLIAGLMRLAKASARMQLRRAVNEEDLEKVRDILIDSLKVK